MAKNLTVLLQDYGGSELRYGKRTYYRRYYVSNNDYPSKTNYQNLKLNTYYKNFLGKNWVKMVKNLFPLLQGYGSVRYGKRSDLLEDYGGHRWISDQNRNPNKLAYYNITYSLSTFKVKNS